MSDKTSVPGGITWSGTFTWSGEVQFVHDDAFKETKWQVVSFEIVGEDEQGTHVKAVVKRLPDEEGK